MYRRSLTPTTQNFSRMDSGCVFFNPSCNGNMMMFRGNDDSVFRGPRSKDENSKRRLFFSSPDYLLDEEYYDEQSPEKKRRLTPEQVHLLEKSFEAENKLEPEQKTQLAKKLGMQPRQVAVWFQNRRARWKTKQLERDYDLLKSSYNSLILDHESLVKENDNLKDEVVSLSEKLQAKEAAGEPISADQKPDPLPAEAVEVVCVQLNVKVEDRLSTGSGESAVVDDDGPQLVDSTGDSYFHYPGCIAPMDGIHSEVDDGSDDGRSYFPDELVVAERQHQEEGETLGWWVWS